MSELTREDLSRLEAAVVNLATIAQAIKNLLATVTPILDSTLKEIADVGSPRG